MKIKVCGITDAVALQQLEQTGVEYAGLIFYPGSKRFIGNNLNIDEVDATSIKKIGVFVDALKEEVKTAVDKYKLFAVQLHGSESPAYCAALKNSCVVIKAIGVTNNTNLDEVTAAYNNSIHYFLFDTKTKEGSGGTGKNFDWNLLETYTGAIPFFLSGGIGCGDAEKIKAINHPKLFAVDINSRFELKPGIKDMNQVAQFANALETVAVNK